MTLTNGSYPAELGIAAGGVVAVLAVISAAARWTRNHRSPVSGNQLAPGGVVTGRDNRRSTSKTIALIWTAIVAWMVGVEAIIGNLGFTYPSSSTTPTGGAVTFASLLDKAPWLYLVFLGGPYAAAAFALTATQTKVASGQLTKPAADAPSPFDVIEDDDGNIDLYDLQYTLFNALAAAIVIAMFWAHPGQGLPEVPQFLAVLTGGSALTYTVNKAVASDSPRITAIDPGQARVGQRVTIHGVQLTSRTAGAPLPTVSIGGLPCTTPNSPRQDVLTVTVPAPAANTTPLSNVVDVVVSPPGTTPIIGPGILAILPDRPVIRQVLPKRAAAQQSGALTLTITGDLLLDLGTQPGTATAVPGAVTTTATLPTGGLSATLTDAKTDASLPVQFLGEYSDTAVSLQVPGAELAKLATGSGLRLKLTRAANSDTHEFTLPKPSPPDPVTSDGPTKPDDSGETATARLSAAETG
jgi:hypothetical protein